MTNFLQDYLDRRRQEQREDQQSPEELLEAMSNNMGHIANLSSYHIDAQAQHSNNVVGGLDSLKIAQERQARLTQQASEHQGQSLDKLVTISREQVKATDGSTKLLSQALREMNSSIRELVHGLRPKQKHEKVYDPHDPTGTVAGKSDSSQKSSGLWDIASDLFDWGDSKGKGKGGKAGKAGKVAKAGRFSRLAGTAGNVLGNVGNFASKAAAPLAVALSAGNAIWEGSKEDSTERYARRFGATTDDLGDGSMGSLAKFAALRAGGAATDIAQALDPSQLWNKDGDSWTDRLLRDRREDAGKTDSVMPEGLGDAIGRATAVAMAPFNEDARNALMNEWKADVQPEMEKMVKTMGSIPDRFNEGITALTNKFDEWGKDFKDTIDGISQAGSSILGGIRVAASNVGQGASNAWGNIKEGWEKRGLAGAIQAIPTAGKSIAAGAKKGASELSDATKLAGQQVGIVSEKYESGGRGVGTVSGGKGDNGGVSYGKYQLATNNGRMADFLNSEEGKQFSAKFQGLKPGSAEFNQAYKDYTNTADGGKAMEDAQHAYMQRTHFNPQAEKLKKELGMDVGKESRGVQEAVWSTATQYGPQSATIVNALKGKDLSKMSDEEKIKAIQDYKLANVDKNFSKSSDEVRSGVAKRIEDEKKTLLAVNEAAKKSQGVDAKSAGKDEKPKAMDATQLAQKPESKTTPTAQPEQLAALDAKKVGTTVVPSAEVKKVYQEPEKKLPASTPPEVAQVQVANADQIGAKKQEEGIKQLPQDKVQVAANNVPDLNSLPLQLSDMGLVLLNIGHV